MWTHTLPPEDEVDPEDIASTIPQSTVQVFEGMKALKPTSFPIASGSTLYVLGKEEEYRRRLIEASGDSSPFATLDEFVIRDNTRLPDFPPGFIVRARYRRQ